MLTIKYLMYCGVFLATMQFPHGCLQQQSRPAARDESVPPPERSLSVANTADSFKTLSEQARVALLLPCGRCHQSTLESHKAGAVAIFDLDAGEQWHTNLNEDRLNGLERRAKGNSSLSVEEREQIAEFVALKQAQLPPHAE